MNIIKNKYNTETKHTQKKEGKEKISAISNHADKTFYLHKMQHRSQRKN